VKYQVRLDFVNPPVRIVANTTALTYTPPHALVVSPYFWEVRAIDAAENVSGATARRLRIVSPPGVAPRLGRSPTPAVTLSWTPVSWAVVYHVQVARSTAFTVRVYENTAVNGLTVTTPALNPGYYFWRVRACTLEGCTGAWSAPQPITVIEIPAAG
jgi:hypothetical protein